MNKVEDKYRRNQEKEQQETNEMKVGKLQSSTCSMTVRSGTCMWQEMNWATKKGEVQEFQPSFELFSQNAHDILIFAFFLSKPCVIWKRSYITYLRGALSMCIMRPSTISLVSLNFTSRRLFVQKNVKSQRPVTNTLFDENQRRKRGGSLSCSGRHQGAQIQQVVAGKPHPPDCMPSLALAKAPSASQKVKLPSLLRSSKMVWCSHAELCPHPRLQEQTCSSPLPWVCHLDSPPSVSSLSTLSVLTVHMWAFGGEWVTFRLTSASSLFSYTANRKWRDDLSAHHSPRRQTVTFYGQFVDLEPRSNNNKLLEVPQNVYKPVPRQGFRRVMALIK